MSRVRVRAETAPVESQLLVALVVELLRGLRGWQFAGSHPLDPLGREVPGLRLVAGSHPHPGARYRLELSGPDPHQGEGDAAAQYHLQDSSPQDAASSSDALVGLIEARRNGGFPALEALVRREQAAGRGDVETRPAPPDPAPTPALTQPLAPEVELVRDDAEEFALALHLPAQPPAVITLLRPARPASLRLEWEAQAPAGFLGGPASLAGELSLEQLPPARSSRPQLRLECTHRRGRLRGEVTFSTLTADRWLVEGVLHLRGRCLLALPVIVFAPFIRRRIRPRLEEVEAAISSLPGLREEELRAALGPGYSLGEVADTLLECVLVLLRPKGALAP